MHRYLLFDNVLLVTFWVNTLVRNGALLFSRDLWFHKNSPQHLLNADAFCSARRKTSRESLYVCQFWSLVRTVPRRQQASETARSSKADGLSTQPNEAPKCQTAPTSGKLKCAYESRQILLKMPVLSEWIWDSAFLTSLGADGQPKDRCCSSMDHTLGTTVW